MRRRNYIRTLGTVGAASAVLGFTLGSGASIDIWADRDATVDVVSDGDALIGLAKGRENGQFVDASNNAISLDFTKGDRANGLNPDARTTIDDVFRIQNQAGSSQVVWIKDVVDDGENLFGDEGPLHFFRGPVPIRGENNNFDPENQRITSQIDPVPGTPNDVQRLSVVGLVPPVVNIGPNAGEARKAWINSGHPVTDRSKLDQIDRTNRNGPITDEDGVAFIGDVVVGNQKGRYFLEPGEEMVVGLDADFRGLDDPEIELSEIQVVSRSEDDAKNLATGEFDATSTSG